MSDAVRQPKKFMLVFKSDPNIGDDIKSVKFDLAANEIKFTTKEETNTYKWFDWFMKLPDEEAITVFLMDEDNQHRCVMVLSDLYIYEHECTMSEDMVLGAVQQSEIVHKTTVQFGKIERMKLNKQSILPAE